MLQSGSTIFPFIYFIKISRMMSVSSVLGKIRQISLISSNNCRNGKSGPLSKGFCSRGVGGGVGGGGGVMKNDEIIQGRGLTQDNYLGTEKWNKPQKLNMNNLAVKWPQHNEEIYLPPSLDSPDFEDESKERNAFICHQSLDLKLNYHISWYYAVFVRGMRIDDAITQLSFINKKAPQILKRTLEEAQIKAVEEHNVEFKSNLWVSESFVEKSHYIKGLRRHGKERFGTIKYSYINYFVTLEEGKPPKQYYHKTLTKPAVEHIADWIKEHREKNIPKL